MHSNELAALPAGTQPKYPFVQDKLSLMDKRISELDTVIMKLVRYQHGPPFAFLTEVLCCIEKAVSETQ